MQALISDFAYLVYIFQASLSMYQYFSPLQSRVLLTILYTTFGLCDHHFMDICVVSTFSVLKGAAIHTHVHILWDIPWIYT